MCDYCGGEAETTRLLAKVVVSYVEELERRGEELTREVMDLEKMVQAAESDTARQASSEGRRMAEMVMTLEAKEARIRDLESDRAEGDRRLLATRNELTEKKDRIRSLEEQMAEKETMYRVLLDQHAIQKQTIERQDEELDKYQRNEDECERVINGLKGAKSECECKVQELGQELHDTKQRVIGLQTENQALQAKLREVGHLYKETEKMLDD